MKLTVRTLVAVVATLSAVTSYGQLVEQRISDDNGVTDWEEWAFADLEFWQSTDGQQRELFGAMSGAEGIVAVADNDEWDDIGPAGSQAVYNSQLLSPTISVSGRSSIGLQFASSWRPEDTQAASLDVIFDGVATEVFRWSSDPDNPNFKADAPDELILETLSVPTGASDMRIAFNMYNARNDWWWAVDNVQVTSGNSELFFEDFESVVLQPAVDEPAAFNNGENISDFQVSQIGPEGWFVNTEDFTPPEPLLDVPHYVDQITRGLVLLPNVQLEPANLKLQVDPSTGAAQLVSLDDEPVALTSYTVTSESGSLTGDAWGGTNLDSRDVSATGTQPGASWDTVVATDDFVFEAYLRGQTVLEPGQVLRVGNLFDAANGSDDLGVAYTYQIEVETAEGGTDFVPVSSEAVFFPVVVEFVSLPTVAGDYNGDGLVDAADYTVWRDNLGESIALPGEDASPGVVDQADYTVWLNNFGNAATGVLEPGAPAGSFAIPEPASAVVLLVAAAFGVAARKRG